MDWISLAQDWEKEAGFCEYGNEHSDPQNERNSSLKTDV